MDLRKRLKKDLRWILLFLVADIGILLLAIHYFRSNDREDAEFTQNFSQISEVNEEQAIEELESIARTTGSWDDFERARSKTTSRYLRTRTHPSPGVALYFFPETLPMRSMEREFAVHELQAPIEALQKAASEHRPQDAVSAYQDLETRVSNFELGASQPTSELSDEAQRFLRTYGSLAQKAERR